MLFLLCLACVMITTWQRLSPERDTPAAVHRALARWGAGYLLEVALRSGLLYPGGPGDFLRGHPAAMQAVAAGLSGVAGLLLWSGISELAFFGMTRKAWRWTIPLAGLSILIGAQTDAPPGIVGFLSVPLLYRFRWRDTVRPSRRVLLWIGALAVVVTGVLSTQFSGATVPGAGLPKTLQRFLLITTSLAVVQSLLVLPRLLSGRMITVRSIGRRLALSHILIGVVPLLLALIFWGIGSYVSVGTERAQSAVQLLGVEAERLGRSLDAATLLEPDAAPERVADRLRARYPGIVVLAMTDSLRLPPGGGELAARPPWPDSLPAHGLLVIGETGYLGAVARGQSPPLVALEPLHDLVEAELSKPLSADLRLHLGTRVTSRRTGLQIGTVTEDSAVVALPPPAAPPDSAPARVAGRPPSNMVSGAALAPVLRVGRASWGRDNVLLTAHVPWRRAAVGLITGLRENPFSLVPLILLGFVALLLGIVENLTVRMVIRLSRSVTAAVAALNRATAALKAGNLAYRIPLKPEDRDELWDVAESFNTMAAGLEEARERERERERLEKELQLARQIQARLLPESAPRIAGLDLAGLSLSAQEVGGDYYDFIPLPDGRMGLVIADVSGKGIPAALLMSAFRASLLSQALGGEPPGVLLERLNRFLHRSVEPGRFVTAFLALLDPATGRLHYSNAGHNPPLVWAAGANAPTELHAGGFMLGAFATGVWPSAEIVLNVDDLLVLYTDGVTEAQDTSGDFWGEERLTAFLEAHRQMNCAGLAEAIVHQVREFEGNMGPSDDITLLLARRLPVPARVRAGAGPLIEAAR